MLHSRFSPLCTKFMFIYSLCDLSLTIFPEHTKIFIQPTKKPNKFEDSCATFWNDHSSSRTINSSNSMHTLLSLYPFPTTQFFSLKFYLHTIRHNWAQNTDGSLSHRQQAVSCQVAVSCNTLVTLNQLIVNRKNKEAGEVPTTLKQGTELKTFMESVIQREEQETELMLLLLFQSSKRKYTFTTPQLRFQILAGCFRGLCCPFWSSLSPK